MNNDLLTKTDKVISLLEQSLYKEQAGRGCQLASGAVTITGNFYGFSVGAVKPDSIKITTNQEVLLNGTAITAATELVNFFVEGEFIPIRGSSIIITGSGYMKAWSDL